MASIPEPVDIENDVRALVAAQTSARRYGALIQAISTAQAGVQRAQANLVSATNEHTSALNQVGSAMLGIAAGFESAFVANGHVRTIDGETFIPISEAAQLAARYVAQLDS